MQKSLKYMYYPGLQTGRLDIYTVTSLRKIKKQLAIFSSVSRLSLIKVRENLSFQRLNQALSQKIPELLSLLSQLS